MAEPGESNIEASGPTDCGSDKDLAIFGQWCEDFRALQSVFWRVPFFAMTITGGLGAAILAFDGPTELKRFILFFVAICNVSLIFIAWRIRGTMETLLIKIHKFEGLEKPPSGFFVLKVFTFLFLMVAIAAAFGSVFGNNSWFDKGSEKPESSAQNTQQEEQGSVGETPDEG